MELYVALVLNTVVYWQRSECHSRVCSNFCAQQSQAQTHLANPNLTHSHPKK